MSRTRIGYLKHNGDRVATVTYDPKVGTVLLALDVVDAVVAARAAKSRGDDRFRCYAKPFDGVEMPFVAGDLHDKAHQKLGHSWPISEPNGFAYFGAQLYVDPILEKYDVADWLHVHEGGDDDDKQG